MKHWIEYDPFDDAEELKMVINAKKWAGLVDEFREYLRTLRKHGDNSPEVADALDQVWDRLHIFAQERGLDL